MNDNEKTEALMESLLRDVNACDLPLVVKALALENLLLRVKLAMQTAAACAQTPAPMTEPKSAEREDPNHA